MKCLKNIIGIVASEHPCLRESSNVIDYDVSESGLFLNDLEGGINPMAIDNVDVFDTFYDLADNARNSAIKKYEADILASLNLKYKDRRKPFTGLIGRPSYNKTLDSSKEIQFLKISPLPNLTAVLEIRNLKLILNKSITTDVVIVDEFGVEYLNETVTTTQNTFTNIPLLDPLTLQMDKVYYLYWDRNNTDAKPRNVKISCGCSGASFDDYVNVRGGETDNILNEPYKLDQFTHGFSITADIRCNVGKIVCKDYDENNAIALITAWSILYKTGEILIESVLNSGEVNRYTMMNREYLWGKRNHFRKEYEDRINYLSESINLASNDCFICRDNQFIKAGILS